MNLLEEIGRILQPIKRRISSMILGAIVNSVVDNKNLQLLKVTLANSEVVDKIERIQEFGFTSNPPKGSEAVAVFLGGNQNFPVIIATDSATYRIKSLPEGAVALYNSNGDYIKLTSNKIEVVANEVLVNSTNVQLGGITINPLDGLVTGQCICSFTGAPHPDKLTKVKGVR